MNIKLQISLLTLGAAVLFLGLRSLPDTECVFLHYQPAERVVDGIEFCGDENPTFLNLQKLTFPVEMDIRVPEMPVLGEPMFGSLTLTDVSGETIQAHELAVSHTRQLHFMIVHESLEDYHHIHPEPMGMSGDWGFEFTPQRAGTYRMFAEFVPARTGQKVMTTGRIDVGEAPSSNFQHEEKTVPVATLQAMPLQPSINMETSFTLQFEEALNLEPVMGALGHMVAFDEDLEGFAHLHPKYTGRERQEQPELSFAMSTNKPGRYRLWAQVKVDGQERFIPFDVLVN